MTKRSDLEKNYTNAKSAFKAREYDRAANLLTQILVIDENYKDASRLLARIVREKRRRWYNDLRIWGPLIGLIVVGLLIWFVPKLPLKAIFTPASEVGSPMPTAISTQAATLTIPPTAIPLAWKRISIGLEFARSTVTGIAVDKNDLDVIYVGMKNAGVYKSIDGGLSWSPKFQGMANTNVESLTIDPQNQKILYAGTLGGIFKTQDGGENWERIGEGRRLLMDAQNSSHLYAQEQEYVQGAVLYESTDQGDTWERHGSPCPDLWSWAIDPQDGMTLFGSVSWDNFSCPIGLYKSSDGGRTWNFLGLGGQTIDSLAVGEDEQGNALIYANVRQGGDLVSNDGGKNWIPQTSWGCEFLPIEPDSPDTVYCSGFQSNVVILTAGKSPRDISISSLSSMQIAAFHADNYQGTQRLIAGGQGLYISTDNGKSWSNRSGGLGSTRLELKIDPANNERMYLASYLGADDQDCVLFRSDDSGKNWKQIMRGRWCGPAFGTTNALYILKEGILERSTDSGDTWISLALPSGMNFGSVSANPYLAGFLYAESDEPFYSTDDGISWQKATILNMNYFNSRLYYAKGGNLIYSIQLSFSTDGGKSWNSCNDPGRAWAGEPKSDSRLVIDPGNPKHLTLATDGSGIFISYDGCQSWQPSNTRLGNLFVNSVALDPNNPNTIYAGTHGGAYVSYDRGQTWGQINDGLLGATVVYSIVVDPQSNVYASTPYGIFHLEKK